MQNILSISNWFLLNEHLPATIMRSVLSRGLVSLFNPEPFFDKIREKLYILEHRHRNLYHSIVKVAYRSLVETGG